MPVLTDSATAQILQSPVKYIQIGRGSCGVILWKPSIAHCIVKWEINPRYDRLTTSGQRTTTRWPNPSHDASIGLANDWRMHCNIHKHFQGTPAFTNDIRVPDPFAFVHQDDPVWMGQAGLSATMPPEQTAPRDLLISERIPPVPLVVREILVDTYCPEQTRVIARHGLGDRACLIRLYLGKRRPVRTHHLQGRGAGPSNFFSLSNFKMYFDQMIDLGLNISFVAEKMADALATMHWKAKIDARDVEFVLGGVPGDDVAFLESPCQESKKVDRSSSHQGEWSHTSGASSVIEFKGQRVCMWLFDFNQCHEMTTDELGLEKAVESYFVNDPYYPRPPQSCQGRGSGSLPVTNGPAEDIQRYEDEENWTRFQDRYLTTSATLLKDSTGSQHLPQMFIGKIVEEQRRRFARKMVASFESFSDGPEPARKKE